MVTQPSGEIPDPVDVLASCPLFAGLSTAELAAVADVAALRRFPARTAIFLERHPCTGLWVLASGRVKLHHSASDGREHIVGFAAPPAPLLLWAVLDGRPLTETATTLGAATALFLPRAAFLELLRHRSAMAGPLISHLCTELRARDIAGGVGVLKDARQRLACRLAQLTRQYGTPAPGGVRIAYRLTRQDLAGSVGVTLETAIRALSQWQRDGLLRTDDQVIEIRDRATLARIAGCNDCLFDCSVFGALPVSGDP